MFLNANNLNVSGSEDSACSTVPKTPEILNSLIALSNPFDSSYSTQHPLLEYALPHKYGNRNHQSPPLATSPSEAGMAAYPYPPSLSPSSSGSLPSSPEASPIGQRIFTRPHSIQHTCSQLIKEGLKLTIQTKRMACGQNDIIVERKVPRRREQLTPEDTERRRRRRERNKIAATKCRNKKKEKTVVLVQESECMEGQNVTLKSEIEKLETEKKRLMDILTMHAPSCKKNGNPINSQENDIMVNTSINYESHCCTSPRRSSDHHFSGSCNYEPSVSGNNINKNFIYFSSENNCVD